MQSIKIRNGYERRQNKECTNSEKVTEGIETRRLKQFGHLNRMGARRWFKKWKIAIITKEETAVDFIKGQLGNDKNWRIIDVARNGLL